MNFLIRNNSREGARVSLEFQGGYATLEREIKLSGGGGQRKIWDYHQGIAARYSIGKIIAPQGTKYVAITVIYSNRVHMASFLFNANINLITVSRTSGINAYDRHNNPIYSFISDPLL